MNGPIREQLQARLAAEPVEPIKTEIPRPDGLAGTDAETADVPSAKSSLAQGQSCVRILHLEDEPDFCTLVGDILAREGFNSEIKTVGDLEQFNNSLRSEQFDLILADYSLPNCTGLEALSEATRLCPNTPFVLVSGTIADQTAFDAVKTGATDYVSKDRLERLTPLVRRAIAQAAQQARLARAESKLARQNQSLKALTENSLDVISIISPEANVLYSSPSVKSVLGYEPQELAGVNVFSLIHPEDEASARQALEKALKDASLRVSHELRFRHRDGSWCHLEVIGRNHSADAQIGGLVLNSRDVSERKQAEAALRLQAAALEAAANAIVITDRAGRITWANAAFSRLTGYTVSEVIGLSPSVLRSGQHSPTFYQDLWQTILAGKVWHSEMINRRKNGELYTEETTITPVRNEAGEITHFIAVKQDISARKRAELQLEQTHEQLVSVSRQAGIAEFATGVLHNVGNVLNSVGVASSCLAESLKKSKSGKLAQVASLLREHENDLGSFFSTDPKAKLVPKYLNQLSEALVAEHELALREIAQLQASVEHIKALITVQQNSAKQSTATEIVLPTALLEEVLNLNGNACARQNIQVRRTFSEIPAVVLQKHKVFQILVNLVRNAIQACSESESAAKQIDVRVFEREQRLFFEVSDNGMGIQPDHLAQLFTFGFTTKKDGHGFGLHMAFNQAKEMGGSLCAKSPGLGRGATFMLELPLNRSS